MAKLTNVEIKSKSRSTITVDYYLPETTSEAIGMWGEEVCLDFLVKGAISELKKVCRKSSNPQTAADNFLPKLKLPSKAKLLRTLKEKFSTDEILKMIEKIKKED